MLITDLVAPNAIIPALRVHGKKQILQELAAKAPLASKYIIEAVNRGLEVSHACKKPSCTFDYYAAGYAAKGWR